MALSLPRYFEPIHFFKTLYAILNNPANNSIVRWSDNSMHFNVVNNRLFELVLCPMLYQNCTWDTFCEMVLACNFCPLAGLGFKHKNFRRSLLDPLTSEERDRIFLMEMGVKPKQKKTPNKWGYFKDPEIEQLKLDNENLQKELEDLEKRCKALEEERVMLLVEIRKLARKNRNPMKIVKSPPGDSKTTKTDE